MQEILSIAWRFEYAIIPCLVAYLIFDLPILYRRLTRRLYVPIYFAFFPIGFSDELYARYIDDPNALMIDGPFTQSEITNARLKIVFISVLSLTLTLAISPFVAALFSYHFLTTAQQVQFFWTLAIVKALLLTKSLYDLRWQFMITDAVPIRYVAFVYFAYWVAALTFYDRTLKWIGERIAEGGLLAVGNGLLDFLVYDIGLGLLFAAVVGFLISWRLTEGTARPVEDVEKQND